MKKIVLILQMVLIPFSLFSMKKVSDLDIQNISEKTGLQPNIIRSMLDKNIDPYEVLKNGKKFAKKRSKSRQIDKGAEKFVRIKEIKKIKYIELEYNPLVPEKIDERFDIEVEILMALKKCKNIITIKGKPNKKEKKILLKYAEKGNLYNFVLNNFQSINKKQKIQIKLIRTLLNGLKQMHENDFIHNDLKHKNVVLDKKLNSKLIDFCFSRKVNQDGIFVSDYPIGGSPFYAAPEILPYFDPIYEGKFIYSKKSDIYALGYILYFIIYGKEHFSDETTLEFIEKVKGGWIPEFNNESTLFVSGMNDIIRSCFQFIPNDRPNIDEILKTFKDLVDQKNSIEEN